MIESLGSSKVVSWVVGTSAILAALVGAFFLGAAVEVSDKPSPWTIGFVALSVSVVLMGMFLLVLLASRIELLIDTRGEEIDQQAEHRAKQIEDGFAAYGERISALVTAMTTIQQSIEGAAAGVTNLPAQRGGRGGGQI